MFFPFLSGYGSGTSQHPRRALQQRFFDFSQCVLLVPPFPSTFVFWSFRHFLLRPPFSRRDCSPNAPPSQVLADDKFPRPRPHAVRYAVYNVLHSFIPFRVPFSHYARSVPCLSRLVVPQDKSFTGVRPFFVGVWSRLFYPLGLCFPPYPPCFRKGQEGCDACPYDEGGFSLGERYSFPFFAICCGERTRARCHTPKGGGGLFAFAFAR